MHGGYFVVWREQFPHTDVLYGREQHVDLVAAFRLVNALLSSPVVQSVSVYAESEDEAHVGVALARDDRGEWRMWIPFTSTESAGAGMLA